MKPCNDCGTPVHLTAFCHACFLVYMFCQYCDTAVEHQKCIEMRCRSCNECRRLSEYFCDMCYEEWKSCLTCHDEYGHLECIRVAEAEALEFGEMMQNNV